MIDATQFLLINMGINSVFLLVLLLFTSKRKNKLNKKEYLSKDLMKIKEQISED